MDARYRYPGRQRGVHRRGCLGPDTDVQQRKGDVLEMIDKVTTQKRKRQWRFRFFILSAVLQLFLLLMVLFQG